MILVKRDVTDPAGAVLLLAKAFVQNPDGTVALQMPDGTGGFSPSYAYQEPNQPGVFGFSAKPVGAYQACKVSGQLVSYFTRPQDVPYSYSWVELPN